MDIGRRKLQRTLDAEQKIDAGQMIGCGWLVPKVARHFGLTESELRAELGMPQWKTPPTEQQGTLFDREVSE
jgi:hypothetical protein